MYTVKANIDLLPDRSAQVTLPTAKGDEVQFTISLSEIASAIRGDEVVVTLIHEEEGRSLIEVPGEPVSGRSRIWVTNESLIVPDIEKLALEEKVTELQILLEQQETKNTEILKVKEDALLRAQADFQNARKRLKRTQEDALRFASESLIAEILIEIDNIDVALTTARTSPIHDVQIYGQGLDMVRKNLFSALIKSGVTEIPTQGVPFNPELHEAVEMRDAHNIAPHTILGVHRVGYKLHDRVLRPAKVAVPNHI